MIANEKNPPAPLKFPPKDLLESPHVWRGGEKKKVQPQKLPFESYQ